MLIGSLSPQTLRTMYLRGIDLGASWTGPGADAALMQLLLQEVAHAEARMGIHFQRWRVATLPDSTAVVGEDYDVLGQAQVFVPLEPAEDGWRLKLLHHDVHAITRVRLLTGWSTDIPPAMIFHTLALDTLSFPMPEERLHIPREAVPSTGLAWAVDYLMGLGMLPVEIAHWCMLGAAIQVLSLGAVAADVTHGAAGTTLTMDNIIETTNYGGHREVGGIYAGPITAMHARRDDIDLAALRFRYQNTLGDRTLVPPDAVVPYRTPAAIPLVPAPTPP